ncbi:MAG: hypothetical protein GEU26_05810 [Nitrososphaeraceae archaeon]|nr:hypothetical protein [Nitrososphaeraceae archaeon]
MSITTATDGPMVQFPLSNQARAASDNELELNCEGNEDMCLVEACLGSECSALGKETGFSEMLTEEILSKVPMKPVSRDSCQTTDEKEEINNFKFRATKEGSDELNSNNADFGMPSQIPVARWDHSGSDILIGMDLGMIKKICNINLLFDDDAEIEEGFSVTVSNGSKSLHKVVDEFTTGTSPESWSSHDLDSLVGRFVHITIPGVSEFYVDDDDDDDPIVSEIIVKALPMTQTSRNSSAQSNSTDTLTRQMPNNTISQPEELSPLEFLDAGSDLLDTPILGTEPYRTNQSSLTDMSSTPTSNIYTGDIFLP